MAKIALAKNTFQMIPEGVTVFKVTKVEHDEDFGKIQLTLTTKEGHTHSERFQYLNQQGEINEGALKAFTYFAKNCLNNFDVDEIETDDLLNCYIKATVKHETYTKKDGTEGKSVKLNDCATADGFTDVASAADVDDFLNS